MRYLLRRLQVDAPENAAGLVEQDDIWLRLMDRVGIKRNQNKHVGGGPIGIRDGLEIAQQLSGDPNVLNALRAARKPG